MRTASNYPGSLSIGVVILVLLLLIVGYFHPITALGQDLGRHLLTGNLILKTHHIPDVNLFSYTNPSFVFINTHWLSQVAFAVIQNLFGFVGLFLLTLLLVAFAFGLELYEICRKVHPLALGISGIIYIRILLERPDLRPELFSYVFLACFVVILYRYREKATRWVFLLPLLQLLWVNMHIYFAMGLIVTGLFVLEQLWLKRKNLNDASVRNLLITFLLCCLASLLNPHGLAGLLYPLHIFSNYGYTIEENQGLFFHHKIGFIGPSFVYLEGAIILLFTNLLLFYRKTRLIDWLLSLIFTLLAFQAVRNFPLFVFATFIPFTYGLSLMLEKITQLLSPPKYRVDSHLLILGILFLLVLWHIRFIATTTQIGYKVTPGAAKAVDFMRANHIHGPIFNNFDIGGYLIYRLYPQERVFVDGRPEAYPASFFTKTYIPMQENPAYFNEVAKHYNVQTIFFSHTDQTPWAMTFLPAIVNDPAWKIVYLDDAAVILVRNTSSNKDLIKRFGIDKEHLRYTLTEDTFEANLKLAAFFAKVNWVKEGVPVYLNLLEKNTTYCPALGLVAQIYQAQNNPAFTVYAERYFQSCR